MTQWDNDYLELFNFGFIIVLPLFLPFSNTYSLACSFVISSPTFVVSLSFVSSIKNKPFVQYSKKMASRITIFWMIYRIVNLAISTINPDLSKALVDLSAGVDTIMIVNMGTYMGNSATEKVAIAFGKRKSLYSNDDEETDEKEEENG